MNKIDININNIRKKFKTQLNSSGWNKIMDPIIDSEAFEISI